MTNYERLLRRCEYDTLCDIQLGFIRGDCCVLDAITQTSHICPQSDEEKSKLCQRCIQKWLNSKEE